jgi:hypothetical protein
MAVSPFGVYLSQEARHYTLPILLITLALLGLIQIQQALYSQQQLPRPIVWLFWGDRQQHRLLRPLLFHSRFHCPAPDANWADVLASSDAAKGQLASRHSCGQWCGGELSALAASVVRGYWAFRNRVALEA